jgi:integrase
MKGGYDTQQEAKDARLATVGAVESDEPIATGTVGAFIAEWLVATAPSQRPSSRRAYKTFAGHLTDQLGHVKLAVLSPAHVAAAQSALLDHGRRDQTGGLSPTTVHSCMVLLRSVLDAAVTWRRLGWNPARVVKAPAATTRPMTTWTPEETRRFLVAVTGERLAAVFWVLATTGMRRGEALGLRWVDVDLEAGKLRVAQTVTRPAGKVTIGETKNDRSRRTMSVDPVTLAELRRHRTAQLEHRLAWGQAYQAHYDLVFAREDGAPLNPEMLGRILRRHALAAGLPLIRVHDLRHGYATEALRARVNPRTVADRLGHSRVNVTLDTYSHVLPAVEEAEAVRVAAIILGDGPSAP